MISDMTAFIEGLKGVNPAAQIVLTVSPVPLMATADPGAHVLSATTYSKSVLRVTAEALRRNHEHVHYFPSYEVITGAFNRGRYYAQDLRNVTDEGVDHVMRLFLEHATEAKTKETLNRPEVTAQDRFLAEAEAFTEVECDEVALDRP